MELLLAGLWNNHGINRYFKVYSHETQDELLTVEAAPYPMSVWGRSAPKNPCLHSDKTRGWDMP